MSTAWDSSHAPAVPWRSGPWSLELRDDELAEVRFDGRRVLRSIRAVVRDRDWNTAAFTVESVTAADDRLEVAVSTTAYGADVRGTVRAAADGDELRVTFDAVSGAEFLTNRTGLVVLHPYQVAGAALTVTHADGTVEQTRFPRAISPHQPVFDIAALGWADDGVEASVAFAGDVFEMEDQRNWTDASFKTYSRPLALPYPYLLPAGGEVRQSVTLRARAAAVTKAAAVPNRGDDHRHADDGCPDPARRESRPQLGSGPQAAADRIDLKAADGFPAIGLGAATAPDPAPDAAPLGDFVLVELDLASPNWRAALARAAASGRPLDVRFLLDADHPLALVDAVTALRGLEVVRVAAFQQDGDAQHVSDREAVVALRAALAAAGIDVAVVGGARSHFTELNREQHRIPEDLDGLTVTVTPLFHAQGTEQLVESIAMQRLVAEQTVAARGRTARARRADRVATAVQPSRDRSPAWTDPHRSRRGLRRRVHRSRRRAPAVPRARGLDDRERGGPGRARGREHRVLRGVGGTRHPLSFRRAIPRGSGDRSSRRAGRARGETAVGRQPGRAGLGDRSAGCRGLAPCSSRTSTPGRGRSPSRSPTPPRRCRSKRSDSSGSSSAEGALLASCPKPPSPRETTHFDSPKSVDSREVGGFGGGRPQ